MNDKSKKSKPDDIKYFSKYCIEGRLNKIIKLIDYVEEGEKISGFGYICENNHKKIINYWIKNYIPGNNNDIRYWNEGLIGACRGNNINLINLMINGYGANDWNGAFKEACIIGNANIAKLMLEIGANGGRVDGLNYACIGGYIDIFALLIKEYDYNIMELNTALKFACLKGYTNIIDLLIEECGDEGLNLDDEFEYACMRNDVNMAKYLINRGAFGSSFGLLYACEHGYINIVKLLLENNMCDIDDIKDALKEAHDNGYGNIVKLLNENEENQRKKYEDGDIIIEII